MIFPVNIFQEVAQGFVDALQGIWRSLRFSRKRSPQLCHDYHCLALLYLAIKKEFEPLLLLPIAFGMLLVNVFPGITANPSTEMQLVTDYMAAHGNVAGNYPIVLLNGQEYYQIPHKRRSVLLSVSGRQTRHLSAAYFPRHRCHD